MDSSLREWEEDKEAAEGIGMSRSFFLAAMFMGIGIGLLIGNVTAWTIIGMGIGFLLDALLREGGRSRIPSHSRIRVLMAIIFLLLGVILLVQPSLLEILGPKIGGIIMIGMGLLLLLGERG